MALVILGAGSWGTALAMHAAASSRAGETVRLWSHRPEHCQQMQLERSNAAFLSPSAFAPALQVVSDFDTALKGADLLLIATPMAGLRSTLTRIAASPSNAGNIQVAWLCKGFEKDSGLLGHEIQTEVAPHIAAGVFSGPSFAQEVAQAKPTAMVIASAHQSVRAATAHYFHSPSLRVYQGDDVVGVEVGGAVKNVLAIATGLCDGLQLGMNARAALITRGLAEMARLGLALGAKMETFMGLTGLGDLVLTATGDLSRNRKVGLLLAQGLSLQEATASLGHVAEGVYSARTVVQRAQSLGIEMPISEAVVELLGGKLTPALAVRRLMERQTGAESS